MAARLARPRIPPGGVGLAIRARMTRSASAEARQKHSGRHYSAASWRAGVAARSRRRVLVIMTAGSSAEPGQQKHRARFTRGELTLILGDPTVPINRQPSTTLNLKLRVRVFDSLEIAGNARPMLWGRTSASC